MEKKLDVLLHDQFEWRAYKDEMEERIKRRYLSHTQEGRAVFLTEEEDFLDYDIEVLHQHRHAHRLYEMQKKYESEGNFISLNRVQIMRGQHDQIAKLRKQIGLSVINYRKQQTVRRNEDNLVERRKRMVFL